MGWSHAVQSVLVRAAFGKPGSSLPTEADALAAAALLRVDPAWRRTLIHARVRQLFRVVNPAIDRQDLDALAAVVTRGLADELAERFAREQAHAEHRRMWRALLVESRVLAAEDGSDVDLLTVQVRFRAAQAQVSSWDERGPVDGSTPYVLPRVERWTLSRPVAARGSRSARGWRLAAMERTEG